MTKTKSTKRALLMSGLALLMCMSMLIGSTFAWFTDDVTSAGNTIQSGTLNVDLVDANGNSMEGEVIGFVAIDGRAQDEILWEPGCTYKTEPVFVVNKGNLALKYEIVINGITGNAKLLEAIDWKVTVGNTTTALADLNGELAAGETTEAIVLTGSMKTNAGNEYQGLTVDGISIAVFATQMTAEFDSIDNTYDDDAIFYDVLVSDANDLYSAVATASGDVVIAIDGDIVLTKALSKSGLKSVKFVAANDDATIDQATYNMYFSGAEVTFKGLTLTHGEKAYGDGGQTSTAFAVFNAKKVSYVDCVFNRSVGTIHASVHNFIGCTFNGVYNPNNSISEYPLYICDGQEYNVVDCVFNCTNRGAILFYNDGGSGVDTLNISNTVFTGDIIAEKTAVEIHNVSTTQVYNVNIKDVVVGSGIINGLYRIKPANVGEVNVTVDGVVGNNTSVSTAAELQNALTKANGVVLDAVITLEDDISMDVLNVPTDVTIDLNGCTLNISNFTGNGEINIIGNGSYNGADVVDSADGIQDAFQNGSGDIILGGDIDLNDIGSLFS